MSDRVHTDDELDARLAELSEADLAALAADAGFHPLRYYRPSDLVKRLAAEVLRLRDLVWRAEPMPRLADKFPWAATGLTWKDFGERKEAEVAAAIDLLDGNDTEAEWAALPPEVRRSELVAKLQEHLAYFEELRSRG